MRIVVEPFRMIRSSGVSPFRGTFWGPMSGRDPPRVSNPDDWFGDPSHGAPPREGGATDVQARSAAGKESGAADDWLERPSAAARTEAPAEGLTFKLGTLLAAAAIGLVLILVAGLAVGGVFSGDGKKRATSPTTAPTLTTTPAPSTTKTPEPAPTRPALPAPATRLKPGDTGAQVKRLQRALTQLGYSSGVVDGIYGASTQAAVMRFQQASGLSADGVFGVRSLQALERALTRSG